ncbi:MAG: kelch repeat-containing protein, partial [Terasakiella sp.]|nr:kelch repeat-containing protein [Terasakiella sp.]
MVGFHFNFYSQPLFGTLVSINTDSGDNISVVASHQGQGAYLLGLVVNEKIKLMAGLISVAPAREDKLELRLDKSRNVAVLSRNNKDDIELPLDMSGTSSARIVFGIDKEHNITDVAPIEVRNIRLFVDHKNTNYWDFKYHDTPTTRIDEFNGVEAVVNNPHWLIDDHTDLRLIYSETVKDRRQTAFDPVSESLYIVGNDKIKVLRPLDNDSAEYEIQGGYRPMAYSNHLVFDTISGDLVNYNLSRRTTARLNLTDRVWRMSGEAAPNEEANYANHAFALRGDTAYVFGGYGFYKFHNDVFTVNLSTGEISECKLQPEMPPATSAAAAVIGDKLYIFGGKGNASGRQELPSKYSYSMRVYDINTWQGEVLWELDSVKHDFLPSQTMYYDAEEDCFHAASTGGGGEIIKISRTQPEVSVISNPLNTKMEYHDMVFDLYRSKDTRRYYLVIDKRIDPNTHDYSVYTICAPFLDNPDVIKNKSLAAAPARDRAATGSWAWLAGGGAVVCILLAVALWRRRRRRRAAAMPAG